MGTRDSTRARLLDAAESLLFTQGIGRTPVDAVLERAGASPATLYRAYGSKEGLLAAALDRRHQEWLHVWDDAVARAPDDRARLLAVFDALDDFADRPGAAAWCAFLATAAEYPAPPPALAAAVRADSEALLHRLTDLARPVVGPGAAELARALVLVVSGHLAMRLRGAAARDDTARTVAGVLVDRSGTL